MFERDKDDLRAMGLCIESDSEGTYRLDTSATFAEKIELSAAETAAVRAVGLALLDDPAFPFAEDLRFALAKIATAVEQPDAPVMASTADERPADQGAAVATLERAVTVRKRVTFEYVNSLGESKHHEVEPYGLFVRDGRWYLVGRDIIIDQPRTYTIARLDELVVESGRPKTPDFERPADFDVARFIHLPFQYGPEAFEVELRFDSANAWRARGLSAGVGTLESAPDSTVVWRVAARNPRRLMRWVVENGPGITIVTPPRLAEELATALACVAETHSRPPGGDV